MQYNITTNQSVLYLRALIVFFLMTIMACNPDFIKENKQPEVFDGEETINITSSMESTVLNFDFKKTNVAWRIVQYPAIIKPYSTQGVITEGTTLTLPLAIIHDNTDSGYNAYFGTYEYLLTFEVEDIGLVTYILAYYNYGNPTISLEPNVLKLSSNIKGEFEITNQGNGILLWQIKDKPEWISLSPNSGEIYQDNSTFIEYTVNSEDMELGEYTGEIVIENNANGTFNLPVQLSVNSITSAGTYFESELIGTQYIKATNQVIAITQNPNQLLCFNENNDTPEVIDLNRVPYCMALSDDQQTLAIGYSNTEITTYNANNKTKIKTYNLDVNPVNMAFGSNDYLYFLSNYGSNTSYKYINSLNLHTEQTTQSNNYEGGIENLKKIPNQDIIITTKKGWSPEFLILYYNTNQGIIDQNNEYGLYPNGLYPSESGERILMGSQQVFEVPTYRNDYINYNETPALVGEFEIATSQNVHTIASQDDKSVFYVASGDTYNSPKTIISIFNNSTFVKKKEIEFASIPPSNQSTSYYSWWEKTQAIYPHTNGSKLWLVQNYPGIEYNSEVWGIRLLTID